jgi:hypothetical protein
MGKFNEAFNIFFLFYTKSAINQSAHPCDTLKEWRERERERRRRRRRRSRGRQSEK